MNNSRPDGLSRSHHYPRHVSKRCEVDLENGLDVSTPRCLAAAARYARRAGAQRRR